MQSNEVSNFMNNTIFWDFKNLNNSSIDQIV